MRILHDEQGLWNKENIVKAFVLGAIVSSCIIYMFLTEVIIVFFISLGLIAVCAILFLELNMVDRGQFYFSQNILLGGAGFVSSLFVNVAGLLPLYLFVLVIALLLLWFKKIIFKKRKFRNPF